jgi:formylglycine-generating enzyme
VFAGVRGRRILVASLFLAGIAFAAPEKKTEKKVATPSRDWHEVGTNHWQIKPTSPGEAPDVTDAAEGNRGSCTPGMIEVKGQMRVTPMGDELQKSICTNWINREFPERCASFDQAKWKAIRDKLPTKAMHFCIDRFEYPNRKGENPIIYMNFPEAEAMCTGAKKRLCTEEEWTFACEGEDARPYPYGFDRDKDACVTDKAWRPFDPSAYGKKETLILELDRLWQGVPSGSQTKCKSPFGVYDMTGNIDEWTRSSVGGRKSILKGGYWGPVRTRCRPSTRAHGEAHVFYQQGVRCCHDAPNAAQ